MARKAKKPRAWDFAAPDKVYPSFSKLVGPELVKLYQAQDYALGFDISYDMFTAQQRAGETREQCKRRMHVEQQTMPNLKLSPSYFHKSLTPRTKREKALVEQTTKNAWHAGHSKGFDDGQANGIERERQRGEAFQLKLIAAAASGKV